MQKITSMSLSEGAKRPLYINFEMYAHFKGELVDLMIEGLQELQLAYEQSAAQKDMTMFLKACHKTKTTLRILDDNEYMSVVEELKNPGVDVERVLLFHDITSQIITSLWIENESNIKMVS